MDLSGVLLEPDGFEALEGNGRITSLSMNVSSESDRPIRLRKMYRLSSLSFSVRGSIVEVELADLPELQGAWLSAARIDTKQVEHDESADQASTASRPPRVVVHGLDALKSVSLHLTDSRFDSTNDCGKVQLSELPLLEHLGFSALDGELEVDGQLVSLRTLRAYRPRLPAKLYQAMPSFPNLEQLRLSGPRNSDHGLHPSVTVEEIASIFDLENLRDVHIASVKGGGLTFEPFLKLPRLQILTLQHCETTDPFEVARHDELLNLYFQYGAPGRITVRSMPKLERFTVVDSSALESAALIECPALKYCWCTQTPNLTQVDLRAANIRRPGEFETTFGPHEPEVLLPEDAGSAAD